MFRRGLFWGSVLSVAYVYAAFPLMLALRALVRPRPVLAGEVTPSVTLLIAAYNEEAVIGDKIENSLALDYPRDRLAVVVVSDGSSDTTDNIASRYAAEGVRLLALPRSGKAAALNQALPSIGGDIVVFSDANSTFERHAIRHLVAPFADASVGGVAGNQVYVAGSSGTGERWYWSFDRWLKQMESRAGSTIAATGAIYAIRRSLFRPIPPGVNDDFVTSTRVIEAGYRLVFASQAIAYEEVAPSIRMEFQRKVRLMSRALRSEMAVRNLLNPARFGFYAVQLASHKTLRRFTFVPLGIMAGVSPLLWRYGSIYRAATVAQAVSYALAAMGLLGRPRRLAGSRVTSLPAYVVMANTAAAFAAWNVVRGRRIDRWEKTAGPPPTKTLAE